MTEFKPGDRVIGLAAFPQRDSELIEGTYVRTDAAGVIVDLDDGGLRTIIKRTASLVDTRDAEFDGGTEAVRDLPKLRATLNAEDPFSRENLDAAYAASEAFGDALSAEESRDYETIDGEYTRGYVQAVADMDAAGVTKTKFAGGGVRDSEEGKPMFGLLRPRSVPFAEQLLTRMANVMAAGAVKYASRNWEKFSDQAALDHANESFWRHAEKWQAGETDEDHAAMAAVNILFSEYVAGVLAGRWEALTDE